MGHLDHQTDLGVDRTLPTIDVVADHSYLTIEGVDHILHMSHLTIEGVGHILHMMVVVGLTQGHCHRTAGHL